MEIWNFAGICSPQLTRIQSTFENDGRGLRPDNDDDDDDQALLLLIVSDAPIKKNDELQTLTVNGVYALKHVPVAYYIRFSYL